MLTTHSQDVTGSQAWSENAFVASDEIEELQCLSHAAIDIDEPAWPFEVDQTKQEGIHASLTQQLGRLQHFFKSIFIINQPSQPPDTIMYGELQALLP